MEEQLCGAENILARGAPVELAHGLTIQLREGRTVIQASRFSESDPPFRVLSPPPSTNITTMALQVAQLTLCLANVPELARLRRQLKLFKHS